MAVWAAQLHDKLDELSVAMNGPGPGNWFPCSELETETIELGCKVLRTSRLADDLVTQLCDLDITRRPWTDGPHAYEGDISVSLVVSVVVSAVVSLVPLLGCTKALSDVHRSECKIKSKNFIVEQYICLTLRLITRPSRVGVHASCIVTSSCTERWVISTTFRKIREKIGYDKLENIEVSIENRRINPYSGFALVISFSIKHD